MFRRPDSLRFLLAAAVSLQGTATFGGTNAPASFHVRRWTTEQGLPQNWCKALAQTPDGYLWVGTLFGLARFDGARFVVFDAANTPAFANDAINQLVVDACDGSLWIGTTEGLVHQAGGRFERFGRERGIKAAHALCAARDGGVWLRCDLGTVARVRDGAVSLRRLPAPFMRAEVNWLHERGESELWAGFGDAAWRVEVGEGMEWKLAERLWSGGAFPNYAADEQGRLWIHTRQGAMEQKDGVLRPLATEEGVTNFSGGFIRRDAYGEVWLALRNRGLYRFDEATGRLRQFAGLDLTAGEDFTSVLRDHEGNVWAGAKTGLFQFKPRRVQVFSRADGMRNDDVLAATADRDGTVWLGTADGISFVRQGRVGNLDPPPASSSSHNRIVALLGLRAGGLWFSDTESRGWRDGAFQRQPGGGDTGADGGVSAVLEDRRGRLWVGRRHSLTRHDGESVTAWRRAEGLPNFKVSALHEDRAGVIWIGTYGGGLSRLEDGCLTTFPTTNGGLNNRVWAIHEDAEGVLWLGTQAGLNRFQDGRFFTFTTAHGLHENVVNHVLEDEFGCLWFGGLRGIYRVAREELNAIAAGRASAARCVALGEADGMLSAETNGERTPSACRTPDGRLWFPTVRGVVAVDPKQIERQERDTPLPPVVIEEVRVDREALEIRNPQSAIQNLQLAPGRARVLEIHYTANCFTAPERVRFRHRLERDGAPAPWIEADARRVAFYTNLKPGGYRFQVAARDHHGRWNEAGAGISFSLAPHFYQTWGFYAVCGLAVVAAAGLVQARRLRWQRRLLTARHDQALAGERARIARDLHDELGARLTALAMRADLAGAGPQVDAPRLRAFAAESRALADRMRDVIWAVDPACDSLEALVARLTNHAEDFLGASGVALRLELPDTLPALPLSAEARHQLTMFAREALHNALKHSGAREIHLTVALDADALRLRVSDNGGGFDPSRPAGRGLNNMRERLRVLGGTLSVQSQAGAGTVIEATIPRPRLHPTAPRP